MSFLNSISFDSDSYILIGFIVLLLVFDLIMRFRTPKADNRTPHFKFNFRREFPYTLTAFITFMGISQRGSEAIYVNLFLLTVIVLISLIRFRKNRSDYNWVMLLESTFEASGREKINVEDIIAFEVNHEEFCVHTKQYTNHEVFKLKRLQNNSVEDLTEALRNYTQRFDHIELRLNAS